MYGCELRLMASALSLSLSIARRWVGGRLILARVLACSLSLWPTWSSLTLCMRSSGGGAALMEVITEISLGQSVVSVRQLCSMLGVVFLARLTMAL